MNIFTSSSSSSEEEEFIYVRRPKIYRQRTDCFEKYDELDFYQRFRLRKETVLCLLNKIEERNTLPTNRCVE